ncbi:hypothetical protein, partial [Bacillus xiapuensis]|nr:hypothetical protein [Bacillus xiapuensis]
PYLGPKATSLRKEPYSKIINGRNTLIFRDRGNYIITYLKNDPSIFESWNNKKPGSEINVRCRYI